MEYGINNPDQFAYVKKGDTMKFKVGDRVKISQGIGEIVWIKPRKALQDNNIELPLVDGDKFEMGVLIKNMSGCTFPYYIHYAWPEYAEPV